MHTPTVEYIHYWKKKLYGTHRMHVMHSKMFTDNKRGSMSRADLRLHCNAVTGQSPPPFQRGPNNLSSKLWRHSFLTNINCSCEKVIAVRLFWKPSGELALLSQRVLCRPQFRNSLFKSHQNCKYHFHKLSTLEKPSLGRDS